MLHEHFNHLAYVTTLWNNSHFADPTDNKIPTENGWENDDGLVPVWYEGDSLPPKPSSADTAFMNSVISTENNPYGTDTEVDDEEDDDCDDATLIERERAQWTDDESKIEGGDACAE